MEFFLNIDGQKVGPLTIYDVREKLRREQITPDTKAWVKGMEQWQPLRELGPLKESVEIQIADAGDKEITISEAERRMLSKQTGTQSTEKPRPWLRFWARQIDLNIHFTFVALMLKVTGFAPPDSVYLMTTHIAIWTSWIFIETMLLLSFGTTPGKWILNIQLHHEDNKTLDLNTVLRRSASVWFRGIGMGIPLLNIFCGALSYSSLNTQGKTQWDRAQNLKISHGPISELRVAGAVLVLIGMAIALYQIAGIPQQLLSESESLPL